MIPKIGDIRPKNRLILAPMAGITDTAFRILCKRHGAGLIYTEMVNANAVIRNNKATLRKMNFSEEEHPIAIQLFGAKTELLCQAAKIVQDRGADIIDVNFGCPDQNVIKQGAGSALLKRPARISEIISALVKAVDIPVTAKMRIGLKRYTVEGLKTAKIIEDAGAAAIAVHGRTAEQGYSGTADWNAIKEIKSKVSIPVIGSGDIFKPEDPKRMIEETGCDFVMIARGCIGNPQLFSYAASVLDGKKPKILSHKDKLDLFFEYIKLSEKNDCLDLSSVKRHAQAFTKGIPFAVQLRTKIPNTSSVEQIVSHFEEFKALYGSSLSRERTE